MTSPCWIPARAAGPSGVTLATSAPRASSGAQAAGDVGVERLDRNADPATRDARPAAQDLLHDRAFAVLAGMAKPMPTRRRRWAIDNAVHADNVAGEVERRAARVAVVDRRVDLACSRHRPTNWRRRRPMAENDAGSSRAVEAEAVCQPDHPIADAHVAGVIERNVLEASAAVDAQHGNIRGFVRADDISRQIAAIAGVDGDFFGFDHVMIGDDGAVLADEET